MTDADAHPHPAKPDPAGPDHPALHLVTPPRADAPPLFLASSASPPGGSAGLATRAASPAAACQQQSSPPPPAAAAVVTPTTTSSDVSGFSARAISPGGGGGGGGDGGSANAPALLPKHTRVRVTGNARTRPDLVGLEGWVLTRGGAGLGGWHQLVRRREGERDGRGGGGGWVGLRGGGRAGAPTCVRAFCFPTRTRPPARSRRPLDECTGIRSKPG